MRWLIGTILKPILWALFIVSLVYFGGYALYSWKFIFSTDDARAAASVVIRDGMVSNDQTKRLMIYAIYKRSIWECDPMPMHRVVQGRWMKVRPAFAGKVVWVPHLPGFTNWWAQFLGFTRSLVDDGLGWVEDVQAGRWKPPVGYEEVAWYSLGVQTTEDSAWFSKNLVRVDDRRWYQFKFFKPQQKPCASFK